MGVAGTRVRVAVALGGAEVGDGGTAVGVGAKVGVTGAAVAVAGAAGKVGDATSVGVGGAPHATAVSARVASTSTIKRCFINSLLSERYREGN